jgi:hypothetical protein
MGDVYGARASLNVWEPKVKGSQDSSAIWISIETRGADRVSAGLRVAPSLSGDAFVRLHVAWVMHNIIWIHAIYISMIKK